MSECLTPFLYNHFHKSDLSSTHFLCKLSSVLTFKEMSLALIISIPWRLTGTFFISISDCALFKCTSHIFKVEFATMSVIKIFGDYVIF